MAIKNNHNPFIIATLIYIGLLSSICFAFIVTSMLEKKEEKQASVILTTKNINAHIFKLIEEGKEDQVYAFYEKIIGNKKLTYLIISNALIHEVPINLFVSLAYTESRFTETAIGKNVDERGNILSYDYGVFQLNSNTYKDYSKEYLMNVENNVRLAAQHLVGLYKKYGTWYESTLGYNAGNTYLIKNITVKHFVSVLSFQEDLDNKFVMEL